MKRKKVEEQLPPERIREMILSGEEQLHQCKVNLIHLELQVISGFLEEVKNQLKDNNLNFVPSNSEPKIPK